MKRSLKIIAFSLFLGIATVTSAKTIEMEVNGLVCAFCAQGIEKKLKSFSATDAVFVSLEHRMVAVQLKDGTDISDDELTKAITNAGYNVKSIQRTEASVDSIRARVAADKSNSPKESHDEHDHGH